MFEFEHGLVCSPVLAIHLANMEKLSQRQATILELVRERGYVATDQLVGHFGVTSQTVRRDINALSERDLVQRFHGGAGRIGADQPYRDRQREGLRAKRKIARLAAREIPDGASLFLNIGTTIEMLAAELVGREDLRIVTNNLTIANMMREGRGSEVMIAGGTVRSDGGVVGEAASAFLDQFRFDIAVVGISAIDEDGSLLDYDHQEIRSAQAVIRNSRRVFLLADRSKFGRRAMMRVGHLADVNDLFTDSAPGPEFSNAIAAAELTLHVAERDLSVV